MTNEFLDKLKEIDSTDDKLDHMFDTFDDWFQDGEFKLPDEILGAVASDVSVFDTTSLIGFLTISRPADENGEITNYKLLFDNIKVYFQSKYDEDRVSGLIGGLEPGTKRHFKGLLSRWIYD